jgi:hypothetical protein
VQLPFSQDEFLQVFARYNLALSVPIALLWLVSTVVTAVALRRPVDRLVSGVLALHWIWSGLAYHLAFFAGINPAAHLFGALFVMQGGLLVWAGLVRGSLRFRFGGRPQQIVAVAAMAYALLYPLLILVSGLRWPAMPVFGVPCPTTILTVGFLLAADNGSPVTLSVIPLLWTLIGGSAAILLGVIPDYGLIAAGLVLLIFLVRPRPSVLPAA